MLTLMNLEEQRSVQDHGFDEIPEIPPFNLGVEDYYPAPLCELVRNCLARRPTDRPSTGELWQRVHMHVASGVGLTGRAMRDVEGPMGEYVLYQPDKYISFAAI
jgi:hypothetical protein